MIYKTHKQIVAPLGSTGLNNKQLFEKYKNEYNIFFESGTHKGDSVKTALDLNFKKIFSVEINSNYSFSYENAVNIINNDVYERYRLVTYIKK